VHWKYRHWFYDAAVSGADALETRPGFTALLARIAGNGARTIIVETANRFALERGKCEGRKSYAEREGGRELVDLARWLRRNADGRPYSLRTVATELAGYGYVTPSARPYSASAVGSMLDE
jgi:hypothetical protein